ncbi:MAG: PAS domain S-box protein [Gammaproteobacteria bacterium]|nr:PAS domain S-box protein [Gammaproteobacteria bacterium]
MFFALSLFGQIVFGNNKLPSITSASTATDTSIQLADKEKVTIQLKWFHQFQFAGYYAAIEKGFYAEEGLEVELRQRVLDTSHINDVLQGRAQYGTSDAGLLLERLQGEPVVLMAQIFQHSPLVFLTREDSGIRKPKDLAGKRVMFDANTHNDMPLIALLLDTFGGLDRVDIKPYSFIPNDLIVGKIDAYSYYITNRPDWSRQSNVAVNIINPRDYGIDFYGDNLFTTEQELSEHPERVEKIRRATLKGWRYALENREEIIDLILEKYNPQGFSRDHLVYEAREMEKLIIPDFVEIGSLEPDRYQEIAKTYARAGFVEHTTLDPDFFYQPKALPKQIGLTTEEQAWLKENPVIRLGNSVDWPPIGFVNKKGVYSGIAADYIKYIEGLLGVRIEPSKLDSWKETVELAYTGELDMLGSAVRTPQREKYLTFTRPYLSYPLVIITRMGVSVITDMEELNGQRVAVNVGSATHDILKNNHPEFVFYPVKSTRHGLMAVENGEASAYISDLVTSSRVMAQEGMADLKISGEAPYRYDISMAIHKGQPILAAILQKALDAIPEEQHNAIYSKWLSVTFEHKTDYTIIYQILVFFALVLTSLFYWNRRLSREVSQRKHTEVALRRTHDDLKISHERLAESELWQRGIFDSLEEGVFVVDPKRVISNMNPACRAMLGYSSEECAGQSTEMLHVDHEHYLEFGKRIRAAFDQDEAAQFEFEVKRKNGEVFPSEHTVSLLKSDSGEVIGIVSVIRDISVRKQAEAELRLHREHLENLVTARTIDLEKLNEQLQLEIFEHQQTEDELRASQEDLQALFDNMQDTFYRADKNGHITMLTPSVKELLQYEPDEMIGKRLADFYVEPDGREKFLKALDEAGSDIRGYEAPVWRRDGRQVWVSTNAHVYHDEAGNVAGVEGTIRNVTERKLAEEALKDSEKRLNEGQAIAHLGSWNWDMKTNILIWSDEQYRLFGFEPGEVKVTYDVFREALFKEDKDKVLDAINKALSGESDYDVEFRITRKDGEERIIGAQGLVERDMDGTPIRMIGTNIDITERKRAEMELRDREHELRTITDAVPVVISYIDSDEKYRFVNRAYESMWELPKESIIGKKVSDIIGTDTYNRIREHIERVLSGRSVEFVVRHDYKNGSTAYFEATYLPDIGVDCKVKGFFALINDITERKQAEKLAQEQTIELEESHRHLRELYQHLDHVREEEKASIAREIHDELGMTLTAIALGTGWLAQHFRNGNYDQSVINKLDEMALFLEDATRTSRNIMSSLRPSILDTLGLIETIKWQANEFEKHFDMACSVKAKELTFRMKDNAAIALFRTLQESLTNIMKHAGATHVQINLDYDSQWLTLQVEDNGVGLEEDALSKADTHGVRGMKERAFSLGGELLLGEGSEGGTRLIVRLPLNAIREEGNA